MFSRSMTAIVVRTMSVAMRSKTGLFELCGFLSGEAVDTRANKRTKMPKSFQSSSENQAAAMILLGFSQEPNHEEREWKIHTVLRLINQSNPNQSKNPNTRIHSSAQQKFPIKTRE